MLKKILFFDGSFKKIALGILSTVIIRVIFTWIFVLWGGFFTVLICDISACAMITLYFRLLYSVLNNFGKTEGNVRSLLKYKKMFFAMTDTVSLILKILFLFTPPFSFDGFILAHILAFGVDAGFSRIYVLYDLP